MISTVFFLGVLNDHVRYLEKIKKTLNNRDDFSGTDHQLCRLGEWLHGEGEKQVESINREMITTFKQLFEPHKHFHEETKKALNAYELGDYETQEKAFTKMHLLSNSLVSILLKMDKIVK